MLVPFDGLTFAPHPSADPIPDICFLDFFGSSPGC